MKPNPTSVRACFAAALAGMCLAAAAQSEAPKAVVVEPVPAAPALARWVETVVVGTLPAVAGSGVTTVGVPAAVPAAGDRYEAWPVILGAPELPLIGGVAGHREWTESFNYQGMHVRLLVLDAAGRTLRARPLSQPPRPGERFRIRVTPTFAAVSEVGLVAGPAWGAQRAGQLYPQTGTSVRINAGETVDLPVESDRYFVIGGAGERLLLSVRHPRATEAARSTQPAYRQDGSAGSSYLQLVPDGRHAAFEQLLTAATR